MDFQLTEEQKIFKQTVHDFADSHIAPMVDYWEKGDLSLARKNLMAEYRELGLLGITLPEKYGGQGLPAIFAILAMEELARITTRASGVVMESSFGPIRAVEKFGTEEQKQRFIPPCARGEKFMSVGMTEPNAGSALTDLITRAVLQGDHYVLNGQKRFISGGGHSDWYMVYVRLSDRPGYRGIEASSPRKALPGFPSANRKNLWDCTGCIAATLSLKTVRSPKRI
jgi:acyl-CoA dehydrogenase